MGRPDAARVDIAALLGVAHQYEAVADIVDSAVRTHLNFEFDGAVAGRMHVASGDALRRGLDRIADQLRQWSQTNREIALVLRMSADRYADVDMRAAQRLA
jgi:hypothetical protein